MTQDEINKAAKEYVEESINEEQIYGDIGLIKSAAMVDFKEGVELANKHWQEKTRWKSLETEPPQFNGESFYITVKHKRGGIDIRWVKSDKTTTYALDEGFIEYKRI